MLRMRLPIFIPSYNRPQTLTTPWLLEESGVFDYWLVLRDEEQREAYLKNPRVRPETIMVTNETRNGPNFSREFIRKCLFPGEWCFMADDNITRFTRTNDDWYNEERMPDWHKYDDKYRVWMNVPVSFKDWYDVVVEDSLRMAESTGSHIVGFAQLENPFFRKKKWLHVGYTIAKAVLLKRSDISWNQAPDDGHSWSMEDYFLTAAQHLRHGRVLINKFAQPFAGHYEPGGCGPYVERLPHKVIACQKLMEQFPGMFRYSKKKIATNMGEVQIRFTMLKQVERLQQEYEQRGYQPLIRD